MKRTPISICALLCLAPCLALAQDRPEKPKEQPPSKQERMYEDIEVFRRLLNRTIRAPRGHAGPVHAVAFSPDGKYLASESSDTTVRLWDVTTCQPRDVGRVPAPSDTTVRLWDVTTGTELKASKDNVPSADGVYLKGHGVVYTVTLPPSLWQPRASEAAKPVAKPLTEWERERKKLRGEKDDADAPKGPETRVVDNMLKLLYDNGHNFEMLGDDKNESISVVITFRESKSVETSKPAGKSSARDHELLGDLHLKQGRIKEAVEAYSKAIQQDPESTEAVGIAKKLAFAVAAQGKEGKQRDENIKKALQLVQNESVTTTLTATSSSTTSSFTVTGSPPAKVIISASRKLLSQAGSGKLSFEDFCKEASVETIEAARPRKSTDKE